ncbi:hypothetical protein GCM10027516_40210 [Niabella aquatica]
MLFSSEVYSRQVNALPNVIIILADDLGLHDVSYSGAKDVSTPSIDALCKAGLRFDRFYSSSSVCSPSRASLLSGCYPEQVGVPGLIRSKPEINFGYLKPGVELLPALLKKAGYHTAAIGKWNLGLCTPNLPNQKGFEYFCGFLDDMMDDYYTHLRWGKNFMREDEKVIDPKGHATDFFTSKAVAYIEKQSKNNQPFFLYLAYNAPHAPIQPPASWLKKVKARVPGITEKRAGIVALIEHMDDGIGKVISALKNAGKYDNTLIIFLSDNGGSLMYGSDNGLWRADKGTMYEGGLRVPACISWPRHIQPERVSNQAVINMDIYATIADIVSIKPEKHIDGVSLRTLLLSQEALLPARPLYFIRREGGTDFGGLTSQAVISGNWKLLQNSPFEARELYNMSVDSLEQNNVIGNTSEELKKIQNILTKHIQQGGNIPWQK